MLQTVSKDTVLNALRTVNDPDLRKDLVTLNMIRDLEIIDAQVKFTIMLTTPACPMKDKMKNEALAAVKNIPGVEGVVVELDADVPNDGRVRGLLDVPVKNAIAVASGKGGVGKSTVAVNLAVSLAKSGARVGLLDADIYGPNVPRMMGVETLPPARENKLVPAEAYGVQVMSIGFLVKPGQPLIWRGPMLHSAIRQFLTDVAWDELDYLVIDLPPGTGDAQLSLAQSLPLSGGLIVTLPQQVSLDDALRGLEMFRQLNVPILGIIENMSYLELEDGTRVDVFGAGGGERLAKEAGVPFIGAVPMDPSVRQGGDAGKPIVISDPESAAARALSKISGDVAAKVSIAAMEQENVIPIEMIG
ncbi:MAG: Mrp/NBP35 family ATP-binding protein [Anaerolineales bacterium]|nr:Mrp/NBP35 family ATP-binding protein [Anaerolineales bacterium]